MNKHAFYSERSVDHFSRYYLYTTPSGARVKVTAVFDNLEYGKFIYRWKDRVYVGVVVDFVEEVKK